MRLSLPAGLAAESCRALSALVAGIAGGPDAPADAPLAPALLFSDPEVQARLALPVPGPGELLIHEYQGLDVFAPLPRDTGLFANAEATRGTGRAEYRIRLDAGGAPAVELRLGLRLAPAAEVRDAAGLRMRDDATADWQRPVTLAAGDIARYCDIAGDRNPVHLDAGHVAGLGLPAPVVPGLLLLALFQPGCAALAPDAAPVSVKARFVAPVYRDRPVRLVLTRRGPTRARGFVLTDTSGAAAIADFEFRAP